MRFTKKCVRITNFRLTFKNKLPQTNSIKLKNFHKTNQRVSTKQLPDQSEGVPDINGTVNKSTCDETERELLGSGSGSGLAPGEAVEALGARRLADKRKLPIVGLEIKLEDLEARGRAERQIHSPGHCPRRHVGRVRRQRH